MTPQDAASANSSSTPSSRLRDVRDRWVAVILAVIAVAWAAWSHRDLAYAVDQNNYLGGAVSLAAGQGYREAFVVGLPRCTIYPPLFSSFLALGWKIAGGWPDGLRGIAVGQALLSALTGALTFLLLRRHGLARRWAFPTSLLFLTSDCWRIMVHGLFSESLMQPLILAALLVLPKSHARPPLTKASLPPNSTLAACVALGLLLALLYLTRSAATAIVGGAIVVALIHVRHLGLARITAVLLPSMIAVLAWKAWTAGGDKTYASTFVDVVRDVMGPTGYARHVGGNVLSVLTGRDVFAALCPVWTRAPHLPAVTQLGLAVPIQASLAAVGLVAMALAILGVRHLRGTGHVWIAGITSLYLLQNVLWWYWLGDRGMLPLVPLLAIWIHAGVTGCFVTATSRQFARRMAALGIGTGLLINVALAVRIASSSRTSEEVAEITATSEWVRQNAAPTDVFVATSDIPLLHFTHLTGRKVVGVPGSQIAVVPDTVPTLAVVRTRPNRYMPQPSPQGATLFTSPKGEFAVRRVVAQDTPTR